MSLVSAIVSRLGYRFHPGEITNWTPIGSYMDPFLDDLDCRNGNSAETREKFRSRYGSGCCGFKIHGFRYRHSIDLVNSVGVWRCIIPVRSKNAVINSLKRKREGNLRLARHRYNSCRSLVERTTAFWPCRRIDFDQLISKPIRNIRHVALWLQVDIDEKNLKEISSLVDADLKHH